MEPGQGVLWKHQPLLLSNQTQVGGCGRWSSSGRKMGDWRWTKANPIVPGRPLGKNTSLCPRHTDMHPAGAQAGAGGWWGGGRQDRGRGGRCQHTQHTAGQIVYRRAGPAAPCQALRARCPSLASAFRIFLFQRQRLHDLEGSLGPGASSAGPPAPCCPRYFLPELSAQVFGSFSPCSSRPSEGGPAPHCTERRLSSRGLSDSGGPQP